MDEVESFSPTVTNEELVDLRFRLRSIRWPEAEADPRQGMILDDVKALCEYWAAEYDMRRVVKRLDAAGLYTTSIDGIDIRFLHARADRDDAFPLIFTHGWPGSVVEYLGVLEPLTRAGFHCVVPWLPGYGWSGKPAETGWGITRIARAWATLMARLGYGRYGAQGSDWGTSVSAALGQLDAAHVAGIHLMPPLAPPDPATIHELTTDEQATLAGLKRGAQTDAGYSTVHRTRPQTIGYSLVDSPAGLAAWICEKIDSWADPRSAIPRDEVIDNLMTYWLPGAGASSARLYWESLTDVARWIEGPLESRDIVDVPTGCTVFPFELQRPSRRWAAKRFVDIRYWNEPDQGGHFPAWEVPVIFVAEIRAFFDQIR